MSASAQTQKAPALTSLTSWGRTRHAQSMVHLADSVDAVRTVVASPASNGIVARGLARSYGDCCMVSGGRVLDMTGLSRIHDIDAETGAVTCEAGVSLRQLSAVLEPLGLALPIYPGTGFVTVGGAIANDVHGKEQHVAGTFGHHVEWLDLIAANGQLLRVSADSHPALFRATVGGLGLTGVIVTARLRVPALVGSSLEVREYRTRDLDATAQMLEANASSVPSMVAWVDLMSRSAGRGVVELAQPVPGPLEAAPPRREATLPDVFPEFAINRFSMSAFNALYFHRIPVQGRSRVLHRRRALFPLDALGEWHRAYGRRGLFQFQCCMPTAVAVPVFERIRSELRRAGIGSTLAVMKWVGQAGPGYLSFTRPGFSLALDFAGTKEAESLITRLYDIVLQENGTVYLAKDACLNASQFHSMYSEAPAFAAVLADIDPLQHFQSDMSRRLAVRTI